MNRAEVRIDPKAGRAIASGHPWVYREAVVSRTAGIPMGAVVDVLGGSFVGRGVFDPDSPVAVRVLTRDRREEIDASFWKGRIGRAAALRRAILDLSATDAWRVVNAEGDFLPGLVIENYSSYAVLVLQTEALRPHLPTILDAVKAILSPRGIYEKRTGPEGGRGLLLGGTSAPDALPVREGNARYLVRLAEGAKTGLFLDMRDNRRVLARYARGRHVVNCFSYTGSLSVAAALGGSPRVISIDASPRAAAWARENFAANGLPPESHEFATDDALAVLERLARSARRFDLAILDPPTFARPRAAAASRGDARRGAGSSRPSPRGGKKDHGRSRGARPHREKAGGRRRMAPAPAPQPELWAAPERYRELARRAIGVLRPNGLLACALNARRVSAEEFLLVMKDAAVDAGVDLQVVESHGQPADFPTAAAFPEGRYLKFLVCALR